MSLNALSPDSVARILECLTDRASTISLLRRTCFTMDNLARKGNFHKVNAIYVAMQFPDDSDDETGLNVVICRKKPKEEKEFILRQKSIKNHFHANHDYVTYIEERKLDCTYEQSLKYIYDMLTRTLEMVKSVDRLRIYNFNVNDDFITQINGFSSQLSSIKNLGIYYGNLSASPEQMSKLIEIGRVDSIDLRCSIAAETLQDVHFQNMQNVYINNYEESKDCPGITDVTIDGWMRQIPETINMKKVRNSFTFRKLWDFILDSKNGENLRYFFGTIKREAKSDKLLIEAQKNRQFIWQIKNSDETHERRYIVTYEHENGKILIFKFAM